MILDRLTKEEIKFIFIKIFNRIESNKNLVKTTVDLNDILIEKGSYTMALYNGYEHKACSITGKGVYVSSESLRENQELTNYYKQVLKEVLTKRKLEEIDDIAAHAL